MSQYFVSTLQKSYCVRDAFQATVIPTDESDQMEKPLVMFLDGRIEGWDTTGPFIKRNFSIDLNSAPKQVILVPNKQGNEDGMLLIEPSQLILLTVSNGEVKARSQLKTTGRKELDTYDYLLLSAKQNGQDQYLILGDKTNQLLVIHITQDEGYPQLVWSFPVQLDNLVLELFPIQTLIKDQGHLNFGVLSGNNDTPMYLTAVEIDPDSRSLVFATDLKEACIRTKDGFDIYQEKIYRIVEPAPKTLLLFCSHSMK